MVWTLWKFVKLTLFIVMAALKVEAAEGSIRETFDAEYPALMHQGIGLCQRIFELKTSEDRVQTLDVLNDISDFLGDRAPFKLDDPEALRRFQACQEGPQVLDEDSLVNRLLAPLLEFIRSSSGFSGLNKSLLNVTFLSNSQEFDGDISFVNGQYDPFVLRSFLFSSMCEFLADFSLLQKDRMGRLLMDATIPLNEDMKKRFLAALPEYKSSLSIGLHTSPRTEIRAALSYDSKFGLDVAQGCYVNVVSCVLHNTFVESQIVKILIENTQYLPEEDVFFQNVSIGLDAFFKGKDFQQLIANSKNNDAVSAWDRYCVMF